MNLPLTRTPLSESRRQLLDIMWRLHFGRIHDLEVRGGDPVFSPAPRVLQDIKLGADEAPTASASLLRKSQVVDLFAHLDELRDCTIETLEVKHGLPFRLVFEWPSQAR